MGLLSTVGNWFKPRAANGDSSDLLSPVEWLSTALSGYLSRSNILFSPQTALTLSTYYACIRNISEDVGKLPLFTYRRVDERTKNKAFDHPLYPLLHDAPNPDMTAMTFRQLLTQDVLGWGNGYAYIEHDTVPGRRPIQQIRALWPLHPSRVRKRRTEDSRIVYDVTGSSSTLTPDMPIEVIRLDQSDMLHLIGFTHDGQEGVSVLQYAADTLAIALSAQDYGNAFFKNSAQPSGILSHPKTLSAPAQERLRADWKARFGSSGTQQDIAVLEEGMMFTPITIPNDQAQFLQTREFQVEEICRFFRIPPTKVGMLKDAHYTNAEQMNQEYFTDCLMPWLTRWEQNLKLQLFGLQSPHFAEHNVNALLRADSRSRSAFYKELFAVGALTPNEIRSFENMNPVGPEGDTVFVAANNYRTLESAIQMSTEPMAPQLGSRNGTAPVAPTVPGRNGAAHSDDADEGEED